MISPSNPLYGNLYHDQVTIEHLARMLKSPFSHPSAEKQNLNSNTGKNTIAASWQRPFKPQVQSLAQCRDPN